MSSFTQTEIKALFAELERLTTNMDVPVFRRLDTEWLLRNAADNNQNHKNLQKVLRIANLLRDENHG